MSKYVRFKGGQDLVIGWSLTSAPLSFNLRPVSSRCYRSSHKFFFSRRLSKGRKRYFLRPKAALKVASND